MMMPDILSDLLYKHKIDKMFKLLPIGSYVKMNPELNCVKGYTSQPLKIIDYSFNDNGTQIYLVDKILEQTAKNGIHPAFVIQDRECIIFERKLKLQKLNL